MGERRGRHERGRRIPLTIGILIFVVGLGILLYPHIMQKHYEQKAGKAIQLFDKKYQEQEDNPQIEALYQALLKYNQELYETGQNQLKDPFAFAQKGFDLVPYGIDDNIIGHLHIPSAEIELPIYLGASDENMKLGATLLTHTSMPIGGENTNAVIAAHRGYYKAKMFKDIDKIQVGDEIYLRNFKEELTYVVSETVVINPTEIDKVLIQPGKDMLTLLTCHPYGESTYRYLVYAERK